jgi:hypothetical protein
MHIKPHTVTAPKKGGGPRPGKKKTIVAPNTAAKVKV